MSNLILTVRDAIQEMIDFEYMLTSVTEFDNTYG